jgi:hypothetical protein
MTLKNAALLALVGMILLTVLVLARFVGSVLNVLRGLEPAVVLLQTFVYAFAALAVTVFFYAFHKAQSQ